MTNFGDYLTCDGYLRSFGAAVRNYVVPSFEFKVVKLVQNIFLISYGKLESFIFLARASSFRRATTDRNRLAVASPR